MKLTTAILTSLMGISSIVAAEDANENINVNVNIDNDQGKVVIIKDVNGKQQTIEESFNIEKNKEVSSYIDEIFKKHGVEKNQNKGMQRISDFINQFDDDMIWVQKSRDVNVNIDNGKATVILKKNQGGEIETIEQTFNIDEHTDIDKIVDDLMTEHDIKADELEVQRKIIKLDKNIGRIENNKPRMGFMANVKDNGWQVMSVVPNSGAAEAGMQKGDVVISINGQKTKNGGLGLTEFIAMDHKADQASEVVVLRDNKEIILSVTAKVIDSPDIIMEFNKGQKWFSSSDNDFQFNTGDLDHMFKGLNADAAHLNQMVKGLGEHEIHVVTTADADAYFFSNSKLNQWLGNKHHFSTITETLGQYFGTTTGVLVLEVDKDNKLGLKDGDVIQAINGQTVNTPKEVIKVMSGFKTDESFEIKIIRKKETLYLES